MKKVLVIVPFPMGDEDLARPQAQMGAVDLGPGIEFQYRLVRVGPKNYSSQHDMAVADFSILDAGLDAQAQGFDAICINIGRLACAMAASVEPHLNMLRAMMKAGAQAETQAKG